MYMNYITTTDLRTQSSQVIDSLKRGKKVSLVHRSKVVGEIVPVKTETKLFDLRKFRKIIKTHKAKENINPENRERIYRQHLKEKYGKSIS